MTCQIKSGTYAADVAKVLSKDEWMDNEDVKRKLGWGPNDSASSVLSDMYTRRCPDCLERREKPPNRTGKSTYEYRLTDDPTFV